MHGEIQEVYQPLLDRFQAGGGLDRAGFCELKRRLVAVASSVQGSDVLSKDLYVQILPIQWEMEGALARYEDHPNEQDLTRSVLELGDLLFAIVRHPPPHVSEHRPLSNPVDGLQDAALDVLLSLDATGDFRPRAFQQLVEDVERIGIAYAASDAIPKRVAYFGLRTLADMRLSLRRFREDWSDRPVVEAAAERLVSVLARLGVRPPV